MSKRHSPVSPKLPVFMHGADYNPDQWQHDPKVLEEDIRLMKLAKCNVMAVGIFAWTALEPEDGVFQFGWLDRVLDRLAQNGIYAWLATPSGARPAWMAAAYPEVLRVGANRVRNLFGVRHNHCFTSPVYREKTARINRKLAERYGNHPAVVGWHISNEYNGECHCDLCQDAFRDWLRRKYGTLESLNRAWWTSFWSHTYTDWNQIESPAPHGERAVHGHNLDWKRFVTDQTVNFYSHEVAAIRSFGNQLPATTNLMGMFEGLDYRKLAKPLDVVSWDAYPTWHQKGSEGSEANVAAWTAFNHDLMRSLLDKPFLLMESTPSNTNWQPVSKLKRPGMHLLASLQAVAHGADSVQYFQWRKSRGSSEKFHGAVVDHVGHEHTRVFRDVTGVGAALERMHEVVGTTKPAQVAILFDWDNRWAVKDAQGPRNSGLHYEDAVLEHYRALWEHNVAVDIIGADDNFDKYALIIAPMLYLCRVETGSRLERFVEQGGTVVATYWSGVVDENDLCHLGGFPGPLRRMLGIWAEELDSLYDGETIGLQLHEGNPLGLAGEFSAYELAELAHAETAEVLGVYTDEFYAGRPALTVNALGSGKAFYIAARLKAPFHREWYGKLIADLGIEQALETPSGVSAQLRSDGEQDYVFLMNFSGEAQQVELDGAAYTDLLTGEAVTAPHLKLPVHGVRVLRRKSHTR